MSARSPLFARRLAIAALVAWLVGAIVFVVTRRTTAVFPGNVVAVPTESHSAREVAGRVPVASRSDAEGVENAAPLSRAIVEPRNDVDAGDGVSVAVTTHDGMGVDAHPAPHIAFEIWSGHPGLEGSRRVTTGTTDDAGNARVTVPTPSSETYWARVVEPGYLPRAVRMSSSKDARIAIPFAAPEDVPRVSLVATPGHTIAVQVVDEAGRPAAADLRAMARGERGEWTERARARALFDGRTELESPGSLPVTVLADGGRSGSGAFLVDGSPNPTAAPVTVVLRAPGELRGRVTDGKGAPIAGLELLVVQADCDDERFTIVDREPRAVSLQMEGRGHAWATLATDVEGKFHATGLRLDRFVVRAGTSSTSPYPHRLTGSPVVANGKPLELTLSRAHVVVRITDPDGQPWGGLVSCERRPRSACTQQAELARLDVTVARRSAHTLEPFQDLALTVKDMGRATFACDVIAGRTYSIALHGGGVEFTGREVSIEEGAGRTEIVLVARSPRASGMLRVRPRSAAGSPFPCRVAMRLEESTTGCVVLDETDPDRGATWVTRSVAPGTYTLRVEGAPELDSMHATVFEYRGCGGSVTSVVVREGESTDVEPVIGQGAQLSLKVTGRPEPADRAALTRIHPDMRISDQEAWASLVTVRLLGPGHWPVAVDFRYEMTETSAAGPHVRSELPFGDEQTSELLTSGTYTLEARTRGGRVATAPVVLVDGQTTSVRLEIPSKL